MKPQNYARDLQVMAERLSRHNPNSFYSEAKIADYVASHFEYMGDEMPEVAGGYQLVDWRQKEQAVARVISHLPEYAQRLLIESGMGFRLYPTEDDVISFDEASCEHPNNDIPAGAMYDPNDHLVHWAIGSHCAIVDFLHELGHGIDAAEHRKYFSKLPRLGLKKCVNNTLQSKTNGIYTLHDDLCGSDLKDHLLEGHYRDRDLAIETAAELFAERTLLQWQHPNHPERVDAILAEKYPEIWPTMAEKYLPFMEKKADALYARNHSKEEQHNAHRVTAVLHEGGLATELAAKRHRA